MSRVQRGSDAASAQAPPSPIELSAQAICQKRPTNHKQKTGCELTNGTSRSFQCFQEESPQAPQLRRRSDRCCRSRSGTSATATTAALTTAPPILPSQCLDCPSSTAVITSNVSKWAQKSHGAVGCFVNLRAAAASAVAAQQRSPTSQRRRSMYHRSSAAPMYPGAPRQEPSARRHLQSHAVCQRSSSTR